MAGKRYAIRISRDDDYITYEIVGWGTSVVIQNPKTGEDIVMSPADFKKHYQEIS